MLTSATRNFLTHCTRSPLSRTLPIRQVDL
jgi:hypothetical protein